MKIVKEPFKGLYLLAIYVHCDQRGNLSKVFNSQIFSSLGFDFTPLEIFISVSKKNVVRGLHLQLPPFDGSKLIYCTNGKALDVLVDLRPESETFKSVFSTSLEENSGLGILIPPGVAHGFYSHENNTTLTYVTDALYEPNFDGGVKWDSIDFKWPCIDPIVSDRDRLLPTLDEWNNPIMVPGFKAMG